MTTRYPGCFVTRRYATVAAGGWTNCRRSSRRCDDAVVASRPSLQARWARVWVAPVRDDAGDDLMLKVAWRHTEAGHEADGLRVRNGTEMVRLHRIERLDDAVGLLLECCRTGSSFSGRDQSPESRRRHRGLLRRLWPEPPPDGPFRSLQACVTSGRTSSSSDRNLLALRRSGSGAQRHRVDSILAVDGGPLRVALHRPARRQRVGCRAGTLAGHRPETPRRRSHLRRAATKC